jgi:hypothetical protein
MEPTDAGIGMRGDWVSGSGHPMLVAAPHAGSF